MAQQQLSNTFRSCLWEIHGERCFHCSRPISFSELIVDHVIPESYVDKRSEFDAVKKDYGIDENFNIRGFENLAPSCSPCNKGKRDLVLPNTGILLARLAVKLTDLKSLLEKRGGEHLVAKTLATIGKIIDDEVLAKHLQEGLRETGYINFLSTPEFNISSKTIVSTTRDFEISSEDKQIAISKHVQERMRERDIDLIDINAALESGVRVENTVTYGNEQAHQNYKIRSHEGLTVIFELKDDVIWVLAAY